MNKKLYSLFSLALLAGAATAQITINQSNVVQAGQSVINASDETGYPIPQGGANKTWNLNFLTATSKDTLNFAASSWYPGASNFPSANLAIQESGDSNYTFLESSSSRFAIVGSYSVNNGQENITPFGFRLLKFPCTYGTSFKDTTSLAQDPEEFGFDPDGPGPIPTIDSVQVTVHLYTTSNGDGWGSLTTPLGTNDVIRVNHMRTTAFTARIKTAGFWMDAPQALVDSFFANSSDTNYQHFYWTNSSGLGFPLATYQYNTGEDSVTETQWLFSAPSASAVAVVQASVVKIYPNPANDVLHVQNVAMGSVLRIADLNGRTVMMKVVYGKDAVNIQGMKPGTYVVSLSLPDGSLFTQKLVKN